MEQVEDRFFLLEREIDLHLQELRSSKSFPPPPPEGSSLSCGEQCRTLLSYFRFLSGVLSPIGLGGNLKKGRSIKNQFLTVKEDNMQFFDIFI
ncbi:hypothetical protein CDAR_521051 [Caerostris darwini]|uniref:Uncharacterized protein n=1 Tax=Caerostris darwini TaxID=1538125 RepID=A0AAV4VAL3_9ARAC|nr:hypothetical protein CDAR_521051 [Caerostris darwini]